MANIYERIQKRGSLRRRCDKYIVAVALAVFAGANPRPLLAAVLQQQVQSLTVTGKLTDETGAALPGVNVMEKGTTNGAVTDANGDYRLTVGSSNAVLVFTFVGTVSQSVVVGTQSTIDIQLMSDASTLGEVVVVGYGTQSKRDITGAVSSVKADDFNRGIVNSPEQLLQGKVAGVNVTSASGEPGAAQNITIRGPGTVRSGSTPLYVIDGIPLDNSNTAGMGIDNGGTTNPLNFLNPQDIASIDVLKDASATAIYGARGANGVVLITTKRGKTGQSGVTYSASYGVSKLARKIDVFSADEFRQAVPQTGAAVIDLGGNTDWQDQITRTGTTQDHNVAFFGGAEKMNYYASLGMQDQEGILKNSNLKRYTGRINVSQKGLNDRLSLDMNLNASHTRNDRPEISSLVNTALTANPTMPAYDSVGGIYQRQDPINPLAMLNTYKDITETNRVIGNISPSFRIIEGLVYKLNVGIDVTSAIQDVQRMPSVYPAQEGRLDSYFTNNTNSLIEHYLTYNFSKGNHAFTLLAGHSYQKITSKTRHWSISTFPISGIEPRYNPGLGSEIDLTASADNNRPLGKAVKNELQSFFGRLNYIFKERYLLTATVRTDGSSKFGDNNKYGTFPSFAAGWIISEEPFMATIPVNTLKLRAGWGQTGNQEIEPKASFARYLTATGAGYSYPFFPDGSAPQGTIVQNYANPNLQWEISKQTDVGLDFGFFEGALTGSVDYFRKVTSNVLLKVTVPDPIQPALFYWRNVKDMEIVNEGTEMALDYRYDAGADFTFHVGGNITFIKNEVRNSPATLIPSGSISGGGLTSASVNGYINGEPIGTFFLQQFTGIGEDGFSTYLEPGEDGESRYISGTALPDKLYNFNLGASYKGFDLSVNFNGLSGNKIYNGTANLNFSRAQLAKSRNTTDAATRYSNEDVTNANSVSTRYLEKGAFLRLNNATLGYNFSPESLGIGNWIKSLRLSVTGQNLFVITDYSGYDPEANAEGRRIEDANSFGIDYASYPKARSIVFGLNVSF
ncbi:TonB-dependent receptor [Fulvivirgaceae bacterium PWU5]|uniref:TonB-dependent receptor n=1 Tax=Dawidia cretensis TaxID=2782350 RepID=A0AAP2GNQ0_9BACT|nr:TonB-dependent receptor [Dawidia cretensis]MBT1707756.1 TonB-dependent receptor [Dawidia cretensis]